jgi:hypothetical protein
MSQPQES